MNERQRIMQGVNRRRGLAALAADGFLGAVLKAAVDFEDRDWRRVKREKRKAALKEKASVAGIDRSAPKFWRVRDNG